ncbi:hypothetical protein [Gynurincola endophyticus]|uniref:hypothetical protein n=1 Tax=Gynurincola endophyticus TaxID=2479004 RepID=UPI000F8C7A64|nr:hypothetical protein [Gynurincola endophyticus]
MRYLLITLLLLLHVSTKAQNGYYITLQGDTIAANIVIPKSFFKVEGFEKLFREVKINFLDETQQVFKPEEIIGFAFTSSRKQYIFETQARPGYQIFTNKIVEIVPTFMLKLAQSKNGASYIRYENGSGEGTLSIIEYYTFTRTIDNELLFLMNADASKKIRSELEKFYAFTPNVRKAVKNKFSNHKKMRKHVEQFIRTINL